MLDIYIYDGVRMSYAIGLEELFRTVRVIGEVPFIEPSPGSLLNLTRVSHIIEQREGDIAAADEAEQATAGVNLEPVDVVPAHGVVICAHGYIPSTCSRCKQLTADIEQAQPPW